MESKQFKFKVCLHKGFLEKGLGLMNYGKYLIGFFALASQDVKATVLFGLLFAVLGYVVGRFWYLKGWQIEENEVANHFNLFVKEMRKNYRK